MSALSTAILFLWTAATLFAEIPLRVPPGFVVEPAALEPEVRFPMFAAFDERGRLFVAESSGLDLYAELLALTRKCRVRLLEDPDRDGRFETSTVFAEELVFPMGLAWRDGKLYVADPPDLVTLEDTDGDRRADKRTVILTGFGHTDNGSLHGLIFGPDGWLYMTMGEPDGYRLARPDGSVLEGKSGALIRCRPDGSEPEVVCRGFENLVEVIFTPSGEAIGTDNWFQRPSGGIRDALVHLVAGGLYPYAPETGTPQPVTGEPLPPLALFPAVALSGLEIYRGTAFPEAMRGSLFSAQHNTRKIARHVLRREGSTFAAESFDFVTTDNPDFHPSDVLEDADGTLLVVDTGSWYVHHCPTGRIRNSPATGGIHRVRHESAPRPDDPWGGAENWPVLSIPQLIGFLSDGRPVVRERAQRALAARNEAAIAPLTVFAKTSDARAARQHALWSIAANPHPGSLEIARFLLRDTDQEIRATAARVLGMRRCSDAATELHSLLRDESPPVRLAAAEALAQCGGAETVAHLWPGLAGEPDRFLEHSLIHAAHRLADERTLQAALNHDNARVQNAALRLLAQHPRPLSALTPGAVIARVSAADAGLRQTALTLLRGRQGWSRHALGVIDNWLHGTGPDKAMEPSAVRAMVLAFQTDASMQAAVGNALQQASSSVRELLLETIAQSTMGTAPSVWMDGLAQSLRHRDAAIRLRAIRATTALRVHSFDELLLRIAGNAEEPARVRLEATHAAIRQAKISPVILEFLLGQLAAVNDPVSRLVAAERLGQCPLSDRDLRRALAVVQGQHLISPSILLRGLKRSVSDADAIALVDSLSEAIGAGWKPTKAELENVLERLPSAARRRAASLQSTLHRDTEEQRTRLAHFEPLLAGGNGEKGRDVFFSPRAACAVCHAVGTQGGNLGPDLTTIGAIRSGRDILESIILPSATFAQGYQSFHVVTNDGTEMSGIMVEQNSEAVVLRDSASVERGLNRTQIRELQALPVSLMPEGLAAGLSEEEFRDLLAFLQQLR